MKQRPITPLLVLVFAGAMLTLFSSGCHQYDGPGSGMLPTATAPVNPTATSLTVLLPESTGPKPDIVPTATARINPTATWLAVRPPESGSQSPPTVIARISPVAPLLGIRIQDLRGKVDLLPLPGYKRSTETAMSDGSGAYGGVTHWRRGSDWIVILEQASDNESTHSLTKDAVLFSAVPPKARLYTLGCRLIGDESSYHPERDSIVAIGVAGDDYWNRRLLWAAYANITAGHFAEIPLESVECENLSVGSE